MPPLAVISGATGTIGRAVVQSCWKAGYSLLAIGHTPEKCMDLETWLEARQKDAQEAHVLPLDLAHSVDLWRVHTILKDSPSPIGLLVTCHGMPPQPVDARECTDVARRIWQCDVLGTLRLCEAVGQRMIDQRTGSIVLISSLHAQATYPARVPYTMSKAAICALARGLAIEWGRYGIRVNALSPWQVESERSTAIAAQEAIDSGIDTLELYRQRSPMRTLVTADDIAKTVLWLADTPGMTGQDIVLDCGVRASMWHRPFEE